MATEERLQEVEFTPMRTASRRRMAVRALVSPLVWLIALVTVALVRRHSGAIAVAVGITAVAAALSFAVLSLLRAARDRDRRRYADTG